MADLGYSKEVIANELIALLRDIGQICHDSYYYIFFLQWQYRSDNEVIPVVIQCVVEEEGMV